MNIYVVILNDIELETNYTNYKRQVKRVFNDSTLNLKDNHILVDYIESLKNQAIEFDDLLKRKYSHDLKDYSEEFYKENIYDVNTENLLSNGLYSKNEMKNILDENKSYLSDRILSEFLEIVEKIDENEKILFWNF